MFIPSRDLFNFYLSFCIISSMAFPCISPSEFDPPAAVATAAPGELVPNSFI
jgi:hypothetical protein